MVSEMGIAPLINQRDQLKGESSEKYITALYGLIENCDY